MVYLLAISNAPEQQLTSPTGTARQQIRQTIQRAMLCQPSCSMLCYRIQYGYRFMYEVAEVATSLMLVIVNAVEALQSV
jgi:hypothetical protein